MDRQDLTEYCAQRMRALRVERRIIQRDLAALAGVSHTLVSCIERAVTCPNVFTLWLLCTALDVTLDEFFLGFGAPSSEPVWLLEQMDLFGDD